MRFRKLRIAWSVAWGIGCVLLFMMLIRSYRVQDALWVRCYGPNVSPGSFGETQHSVRFKLTSGRIIISPRFNSRLQQGWYLLHEPPNKMGTPYWFQVSQMSGLTDIH